MASSIAQLLGQNKFDKKVKNGLFCRILICLPALSGRLGFTYNLCISPSRGVRLLFL
jgi:hypothetical protein